jgi:hypothetical protein
MRTERIKEKSPAGIALQGYSFYRKMYRFSAVG